MDTEAISVFLAQTAADFAGQDCLMLIDGAGWHRATPLRVPSTVRLLALAAYNPELNPVEHLWDYLREKEFANRAFPTLGAVMDCLCAALRDLDQHSRMLKSMSNFDWINGLSLTLNTYKVRLLQRRSEFLTSDIGDVLPRRLKSRLGALSYHYHRRRPMPSDLGHYHPLGARGNRSPVGRTVG